MVSGTSLPSADEIRKELARILSGRQFSSAESLGRILAFVVEQTLEGHASQLKESVIATGALHKTPSFDPKADPIVRVQMGRLRERLGEYYLQEGVEDRVIFEIPKGSYVPRFRYAEKKVSRRVPWVVATASAAAVVVVVAAYLINQYAADRKPGVSTRSVAVVPFTNLGRVEDAYLAAGLTDDIIRKLLRMRELRIFHASAEQSSNLDTLKRQTGADAVLKGALRTSGEEVRVTATLLHAADSRVLWTEEFTSLIGAAAAIPNEIVRYLADHIGNSGAVVPPARGHSVSLQAYKLYLRGRYALTRRTVPGTEEAINFFNAALKIDPELSAAYSGLTDAYNSYLHLEALPSEYVVPHMKVAAENALRLDSQSAETHGALGTILWYEWDFAAAEREFQRAIELNPNYAYGHLLYGIHLSGLRRYREGAREVETAISLDPLSALYTGLRGTIGFMNGDTETTIRQAKLTLKLDPTSLLGHHLLGCGYALRGEMERALSEHGEAVKLSGGGPLHIAYVAYTSAIAGRRDEAKKLLSELLDRLKKEYIAPAIIARIYAGLDDRDQTMYWLDRAFGKRPSEFPFTLRYPVFNTLKDDPRFQKLLKKIGLPLQ